MAIKALEKELLELKEEIYANTIEGIDERIESLLQRCKESGDNKLIGISLLSKASYLRRIGSVDASIQFFQDAFKYFMVDNHSQLQVSLLNELGTTYLDLGQDDEAMECFFRALDILNKEQTYDVTRASIANNLGTAYYDMENYAKARKFFEEAYDLLIEEKVSKQLPIITFNLAESYYYLGEMDLCHQFIDISKEIAIKSEDKMGLAFACSIEAIVSYDESDKVEWLLAKYEEFKAVMLEAGDITSLIELDHMFSLVLHKHQEWAVLKPILEEVYRTAIEVEVVSRIHSISQMLKDLYIAENDYKSAYEIVEKEVQSQKAKIVRLEKKRYSQVDENYQQINNQHYVDKLEESVRIFKLLSVVGNGIILNKDIKGIFDYIIEHIYSIWDLDVFAVAIADEDAESITYYYNTIEEGNRVGKRSRGNESILMNYCINNNSEIVINDTTMAIEYKNRYPEAIYQRLKESSVKSLIFTPMTIGDRVIGGLTVQSNYSDYFNSGALEVVRTIAAYCSAAIVNHQRHLKLQKMKDIDGLTGVYNRHALITFNNKFDTNSKKKELPLFIAMLDIDYFKQYNDNYGHIAGDVCIVNVVQIIKQVIETYGGELYRYGGDEFNIIVEACDEARASEMLDLILNKLDQKSISHEYSGVSDKVTLSIGGIVIEEVYKSSTEYYQQVDQLLYEVKRRGRNGFKIVTL